MRALRLYFVSIKKGIYQIFASAIMSVRHWQPCGAWRSNPPTTRQPNYAWDCFPEMNSGQAVPYNDGEIENYNCLISPKQKFEGHSIQHVLLVLLSICSINLYAQANVLSGPITVDAKGTGKFKSIQAAINSLSDSSSSPRTIYIRKGVYNEKVYIRKHNIVLLGEDKDKTIITQAIARDEWRCAHPDDWGVATLNIDGNDVTLNNLTITNSFGFDLAKKDTVVYCGADTGNHQKITSKDGHQMALRTMKATRFKAINCRFRAFGGDTVSPWNVDAGMFYFKNCIMEGGVDFYCPRGWAYAENCTFIAHIGPASIWHNGSKYPDSKTVLKNCSFEGFDGFNLGRYHRDAQFYLINCSFANKDIYLVATDNIIQWGKRVYYYNCHRKGGDYTWHKNNLDKARNIKPADITVNWLFKGKWKPEEKRSI